MEDYLMRESAKTKRARRIYFTQKKKEYRMRCAKDNIALFYPYYIKSECMLRECVKEFIPEHLSVQKRLLFNPETLEFSQIIVGEKLIPAHYKKRVLSQTYKAIKPYLKQYCRTACRAHYKHLAVRKERYAKYDYAPSSRANHKRVAEVDWLAW